jgi:hypothetical protein
MCMEIGYFDEAGGSDCGFTFVCGWISSIERWEKFEIDWKLLLSFHDLPYFHMKEFSQSLGPFGKWKNSEGSRRKFLMQASDVIHTVAQRAFICGVQHEAFKTIHKEYPISFSSPYAFAGRICIAWANAWCRLTQASLNVKYVFEDGGPDKSGLIASISRYPVELSRPIFEPSRLIRGKKGSMRPGVVQLQAADFLAYEIRKFFLDHPKYKSGERRPRVSLGMLRDTPADIKLYGYERLSALCRSAGLKRKDSAANLAELN